MDLSQRKGCRHRVQSRRRKARSDAAARGLLRHNSRCEVGVPFCTVQMHGATSDGSKDPRELTLNAPVSSGLEVNRFPAGCPPAEERRSRQDIRSVLDAINDKMKFNP
jgi:hypothetical protein